MARTLLPSTPTRRASTKLLQADPASATLRAKRGTLRSSSLPYDDGVARVLGHLSRGKKISRKQNKQFVCGNIVTVAPRARAPALKLQWFWLDGIPWKDQRLSRTPQMKSQPKPPAREAEHQQTYYIREFKAHCQEFRLLQFRRLKSVIHEILANSLRAEIRIAKKSRRLLVLWSVHGTRVHDTSMHRCARHCARHPRTFGDVW